MWFLRWVSKWGWRDRRQPRKPPAGSAPVWWGDVCCWLCASAGQSCPITVRPTMPHVGFRQSFALGHGAHLESPSRFHASLRHPSRRPCTGHSYPSPASYCAAQMLPPRFMTFLWTVPPARLLRASRSVLYNFSQDSPSIYGCDPHVGRSHIYFVTWDLEASSRCCWPTCWGCWLWDKWRQVSPCFAWC